MDIISIYFLVIAFLSAFLYYLIGKQKGLLLLIILSCIFVGSLSVPLLIYVTFFSLLNFILAIQIKVSSYSKLFFRLGLIFNILQIILLKYAHFAIDPILDLVKIPYSLSSISDWIAPIGISYFTLQAIGYLINVKMKWEEPERCFQHFFLYIIFYPKFLSGPIERSNHFLHQLKDEKYYEYGNIIHGAKIVLWGLFKKLIIANHMMPFVNYSYSNMETLSSGHGWLLIFVQPLYLYFDFSAYTDIAIGFAKMYGIDLVPNFNRPFLAQNITGFWKRFHISLSSWFNDYIFKQLSFKWRKWGLMSSVVALFVTWVLFGIWHGAGWNFMALGFVLAISILYEFLTKRQRSIIFSKLPDIAGRWIGRFFTFSFYGWALSFFFSPDFKTTLNLFHTLISFKSSSITGTSLSTLLFGLSVAFAFLFLEVIEEDKKRVFDIIERKWIINRWFRLTIYFVIAILILSEIGVKYSFVYEMF